MNQHQILTGAVNAGDCYSVGSVEGVPFTAYSAGCNIVILASNFQRVQIIPGILHGNVQVNCLDCSTDVGKIAAAYGKNICIFEPTPILDANSDHKLNYKWIKTAVLQTDCYVSVISWNLEGTKLLTGGTCIQLWHLIGTDKNDNTDLLNENNDNQPINFKLNNNDEPDSCSSQDSLRWACVWQCSTATNVCFLSFSPDGSLFVSAGKTDRLAKIWYRSAANHDYSGQSNIIGSEAMQKRLTSHVNNVNYTFVYIVHPRAITGICWRRTSKYMPKSSVANMLVTSCKDNISRLWVQTLLPEDGLVNFNSIEGLEQNTVPRVHTTRHRQKIMQRLKHMKTFSQFRKRHASNNKNEENETNLNQMNNQPIPNMPSTYSVHDFHCFGIHGAAMIPGIHFHLAASINAKSDIPLVPKLEDDLNDVNNTNEKSQPSFVMHWLNNKEMIFTQQAEKLLQQISKKIFKAEENANKLSDNDDTDENLSNDEELAMNEDTREQQLNDDNFENEMNSSTMNAEAGKKFRHKLCKNVGVSKKLKKKKELILKQIQENHQKIHPLTPINNNVTNNTSTTLTNTTGQEKDLDLDPDSSISAHVRSSIHTLSSSHSNVDLLNNTPAGTTVTSLGDFIDRKFETLLREWHTSYDLLFSIHPVDGSLLVWLVEWLDESCPGSFRQAQVSFSSRIPNAIPLGDAITMSHNVSLYAPQSFLDLRFVIASNGKQFDENCCEYGCCRIEPTTENGNKKEEEEDETSNENDKDGINNEEEDEDDDDDLYQNDQNKELDKNKMLLLTPTVCMVTKHNNGSLNLWHIGFAENTNFTQVLSISHENRVCGHRFRVNDISCHPVLPLLLTTSHHNLPGLTNSANKNSFTSEKDMLLNDVQRQLQSLPNSGFCSELILWKVDSVGPLSKSGGVTELARINSPNTSAFANVAWIPTLLPSTTLGSISNSPSACFIASDGNQLHVYQSVIDARTLLAELSSAHRTMSLDSSGSFDDENAFDNNYGFQKNNLKDVFKIVSLQSTSRPGCILELDAITDANHDWQNTQLLHVFQDQMITGDVCYNNKKNKSQENLNNPSLFEPGLDAVVDLRHSEVFKEPFYLVLLEKNEHQQSVLHMWKLVISSQTDDAKSNKYSFVPDSNLVQDYSDGEHSNLAGSRMDTPDFSQNQQFHYNRRQSKQSSMWKQAHHQSYTPLENEFTPLKIKTEKVCTQILPLPEDVEVIHATPAAGHLSSSNIYPACFAPYLLCTACSDGSVRFWKCQISAKNQQHNTNKQKSDNVDGYEEDDEYDDEDLLDNDEYFVNKKNKNNQLDSDKFNYNWTEWEFMIGENKSSMIEVSGFPMYVSCAYSGRIACAYKDGQSYSKPTSKSPNTRFININLAIYECESTGGSEWNLEDVIHLKNIVIPQTDNNVDIDLTSLIDTTVRNKKTADTLISKITSQEQEQIEGRSTNYIQRLLSVPSYTTIQTLKKIISEQGNQFTLTQKSIVQLDWVSTEDGSHVLSVSVGNKISIFTPVSTDIAQANLQAMKASLKTGTTTTNRMLLKQASSMVANPNSQDDIRWMSLRTTHLKTADGLSPLPMQMSWVRDGILVVGMDNEMHIYSQWKSNCNSENTEETLTGNNNVVDSRVLTEHGLLTHAQESSHLRLPTHNIPRTSSNSNLTSLASKTESNSAQLDAILNTKQTSTATKSTNINTKSKSSVDLSAFSQLPDFGIFEASRLACPVLPQYHPKQLMELLAFGKIQRVKAILNHLVISLCTYDSSKTIGGQTTAKFSGSQKNLNSWTRTRTLSIAGGTPMSPNYNDSFEANIPAIPEEVTLDYTEINSVRPLPLFTLIQAEIENPQQKSDKSTKDGNNTDSNNEYDSLFSTNQKSQIDETLDEILGKSSFNFNQMQKKQEKISLTDFGSKQARLLTKLLTHSHLPGLSSLDQMHLLALADAVASFSSKNENIKDESNGYGTEQKQTISSDSLDDCGLRFILTMRQHVYLLCCLPLVQRKQLQLQGLSPCNLVWAFHSEAQEEILQLIPCIQKQSPKWSELKELGCGWWIRSNFVLKKLVEQLAKASFTAKQDPLDAALFYLAMKKKSLVWGLYRSIGDKRMTEFFQNNFNEEKWRKAALKNAFALLGKQRFEHAAAFFLLAGSLYDAIEVCINKLDDLQLAMVIIRLYEGDVETVPETLKKILYQEVLGCAQDGTQYDSSKCHPDAFYRSMAYWMLGDYNSALNTLLEIDIGHNHVKYNPNESDKEININPSVFNFYLYLRNQPLIVRRQLAQTIQQDSKLVKGLLHENISSDAITPFERRLYFITAHQHFRAGCPSLALEVLSRLPNRIILDDQSNSKDTPRSSISSVILKQQSTDTAKTVFESPAKDKAEDFDWGAPVSSQSGKKEDKAEDLFDWSTPVSLQTKEDSQFKIDIQISSSSSSEDEKDQLDKEKKTTTFEKESSLDQPQTTTKETNNNEKSDKKETKLDIMAQQLRFIACLKILMEELSTLATGFEVDGGQLRYHLYVWLEKSVLALKVICNYRTFSMRSGIELFKNQAMILDDSDLTPAEKSPKNFESGYNDYKAPTLHEILIADKLDFEEKLQRAQRRKQWLQSNESLLRTLLSYCSLHGGHGGGLAAVRMELILLLQELQQDRTNNQLLSPVPFPTTLPLLAASVACQKTVIADPIKHLHSMTHDILETVLELRTIPLNLPPNYCEIYVLRDLGISLSACVYQSLCDSDSFSVKMSAKENKQSKISANLLTSNHATVKRQLTNASDSSNYSFKSGQLGKTTANSSHQLNAGNQNDFYLEQPISEPIKWPGVQSLRALLARDKDEDSPKLHTLLCEAYCAVYLSQLLFALAACDSHILFRLVTLPFETKNWSQLFGGGVKKLLNVVKVSRMDSNLTTTSHLQTPGQAQSQNTASSNLQTSTSGGIPIPQSSISSTAQQFFSTSQQSNSFDEQSSPTMNLLSALSKQRRNFNMKILQHLNQDKQSPSNIQMSEDKPTYREHFVAPQMSILSFLMTKTQLPDEMILIDYDSSESVQSEEDYDAQFDLSDNLYEENLFTLGQPKDIAANQSTYDQFAWGMMRYAVLKLCKQHLDEFLNVAGLEMQDLPTISPLIHAMFKVIDIWIDYLRNYMDSFPDAPLPHFLPNTYVEPITNTGGPSIFKYKALLELNNTPFRHHNGITKPMKRLWNYLVRQELVQPIFIRYIFGQRKTINGVNQYVPPMDSNVETDYADKDETTIDQQNLLPRLDPTRIVHKDQDLISAFCVNHANPGLIALSTPKEIQELDMSVLLGPVPWLEEEAEYDILNLLRGPESLPSTNYLVVQHPSDRLQMSPANIAMQNSTPQVSMSSYQSLGQTGRSTIMPKHNFPGNTNPKFCQYVVERSRHILKPLKSHKLEGTKRMCSHPTLPLYLSGSQDGSVKLWEWNHQQELSTPQSPGKFGKVTRVLFNQLGNKFGICDADGNLSLWQVSLNTTKPFYTVKAHSKQCSDFTFLGCSSVVVTAGESVDHRNIALWDTLLKPRKSRVSSFSCLESHGASAILYCPINQVLLAGGRRGELYIIEVRQKKERAKWQAHETPIKCMALEPGESYFATGSADGDIKVWSLGPVSVLLFSFPGEHSRNTIFRNLGMGVSHLYIDAYGRLFSCGADGSLKVRVLPDRNSNIVCSL